jgi:TPP-dependent pyruvate/acetoin dehydrogenase alpha subunit
VIGGIGMGVVKELDLISVYRDMVLIRSFEEKVEEYSKKGHVPGFIHLGIGQEAVQAGCIRALRKTDYKLPDHRSHGVIVLSGSAPERVMAEIFAKKTGLCQGKGGSMHIADVEVRNLGNNGVQGSTLATALGPALASKIRRTDDVTAVFFGDGTVGRGEFHESLHLAALWRLPVVYVLANNGYAISTRAVDSHPLEDLAHMGCAYGIPGLVVDGNDVEAVYEAMCKAVDRARKGEGPTILEAKTYRWQGHFAGDPAAYRPDEEVRACKEKCPIKRLGEKIISQKVATKEDLGTIRDDVLAEVEKMVQFAVDSPLPKPEDALEFVYVGREVKGR